MIRDPLDLALLLADILQGLGVPYLIGGSVASAIHGEVRTTLDVDMVADLKLSQVEAFLKETSAGFYVDEDIVRRAVRDRSGFNMIHREALIKADIYVPPDRPDQREQMKRRRLELLRRDPDRRAYIATPEDVILQKLHWFKAGGEVSDRQWRDVLGVVKAQGGRLDIDYLRRTSAGLSVAELLERALSQAGIR